MDHIAYALLLIFSTTQSAFSLHGIIPEKFVCDSNPSECYDTICNMTKLSDRFKFNITFGCRVKQPQPKVFLRLQLFRKVKPNKYVPAFFDTTIDLCSISAQNDGMFRTFLPGIKEQIEKYMHACPYSGTMVVHNMSVNLQNVPVLNNGTSYKLEATFINKKYSKIFKFMTFVKSIIEN